MGYVSSDTRLGVPALTGYNVSADGPAMQLGTIVTGIDQTTGQGGEFMYVRFAAQVTVGQVVVIDNVTDKCALASSTSHANSGKPVGFVMAADTLAADAYGFVQISGAAVAKAAASAANAKVMLTATPGTVDDAAIAGSQLIGAEFSTADGTPAAGFATLTINRPSVQSQIT